MSDYIKREDAENKLVKIIKGDSFTVIEEEAKKKAAKDFFADIPTTDVVEVVRCKDCKHYGKFGMKCNKLHLTPIESWHYCSFGERADT